MKILLIGRGKMGKLIRETAESTGDEVVAALGHDDLARLGSMNRVADVVIDFSRPQALDAVCEYVRRTGTPLVSGTTGYTPEQKRRRSS
ncbi:MAG: 4-hydroxy-tetrahydrodipicolinate reductase, partial [Clostridiales bacterium]|nr:4-hydroxy-tetrahydrodipicolinate reductase [Clostridiales bacterium]